MDLNQITIPSRNTEKAVLFYQQLGLQLIVDALPRYARLEMPKGHATLSIHQTDNLSPGEGIIMYFECDEVDKKIQELLDKGIGISEMPEDKTWLWREARIKDPDGHQIIIYHAGENRKNPPWRIIK